jgi:peptidoglycan/xylan/chitin deacetylase (PgdA/CDA1 family)
MAVERYPDPVQALHADGHEICSHGYRWIDYQYVDEATEREHLRAAIAAIEQAVGERPRGWYTGRSGPNTRRLVVEEGGFVYDADDYNDELPYWNREFGRPHLVIPYTLTINDMVSPRHRASTAASSSTRVFEGQLRRALCRGRRAAAHAVGGCTAALRDAPGAWPRRNASSAMCARTCVVVPPDRHRRALAGPPSGGAA